MSVPQLVRLSGAANVLGGLALALFVVEHPWGRFDGAEVARTTAWSIAHGLHFLGATLVLVGLVGLYLWQAPRLGRLGLAGFVVAFVGTAMFVGTGMITVFVWPMVAREAPQAVALGGAMFDRPSLVALGLTAVTVTVGYVLFGLTMLRAGLAPRWMTVVWVVGAVTGMIPPQPLGPLPWAGLVLGGVLFGAGAALLGYTVWSRGGRGVS